MASILFFIFLTLIGIQLVYFLVFTIGLSRYKKPAEENEEPVSVIIAARNEIENLKTLLPRLYAQCHSKYEIVVINDQSTDETYDYLKEESANQPLLKVVTVNDTPPHVNAKKYALTLGIKAAAHDLLLLTDADCLPASNHWISGMARTAKNKSYVLGTSFYQQKPGLLNYFIRFETILTAIQYISFALLGRPYMGVGRNLCYRKAEFLDHKGFNGFKDIAGGDDDLLVNKYGRKSNTAVNIDQEAQTYSIPKTSWGTFLKQKLRHIHVGKQYKTSDKIILGLFSLSYILSWLLLPVVLINHNELYFVIGSFFIRTLFLYLMFFISTKKLNVTFNVWGLIFLDFIYFIYYSYTGIIALFTKRVTWS